MASAIGDERRRVSQEIFRKVIGGAEVVRREDA